MGAIPQKVWVIFCEAQNDVCATAALQKQSIKMTLNVRIRML